MLQDPRLAAIVPVDEHSLPVEEPTADGTVEAAGAVALLTDAPVVQYRLDMKQEWVTIAGGLAIAASFAFDGHTSGADQAGVAQASSIIHVLAGGVWFGGLVVLADTLGRRWRAAVPTDAAATVLRFSRSAVFAVVLVALAGVALAWSIIDTPSELFSSSWGRVLLVKVGLVAAVVGLGAYNHFIGVPAIESNPDDEPSAVRLRRIVVIEATILVIVVVVAAVLVGVAI